MEGWRKVKMKDIGTSLVVQWRRLCIPSVRGLDSIPGRGTRSYMLWLRVRMPQLRISDVINKKPHVLQLKNLHASVKIKDPGCLNQDPVQPNK